MGIIITGFICIVIGYVLGLAKGRKAVSLITDFYHSQISGLEYQLNHAKRELALAKKELSK